MLPKHQILASIGLLISLHSETSAHVALSAAMEMTGLVCYLMLKLDGCQRMLRTPIISLAAKIGFCFTSVSKSWN